MKPIGRIIMMILVVFMAGTCTIHAQRGMRGMTSDSVSLDRPGFRMMQTRPSGMHPDSMRMNLMRDRLGQIRRRGSMWGNPMLLPHPGFGMRRGIARNPAFRFRNGFGSGHFSHPGFGPMAPGLRRLETLPDLTDIQKKEIADLRQLHQDEMQKFREETADRMNDMRNTFRKKVMDILTDEQKKYLEGNSTISPPAKN